jgi:AMMECR1 domain-containing protein
VGRGGQFRGDYEQAAILASFNAHCFRRVHEEELAKINDTKFKHAVDTL